MSEGWIDIDKSGEMLQAVDWHAPYGIENTRSVRVAMVRTMSTGRVTIELVETEGRGPTMHLTMSPAMAGWFGKWLVAASDGECVEEKALPTMSLGGLDGEF